MQYQLDKMATHLDDDAVLEGARRDGALRKGRLGVVPGGQKRAAGLGRGTGMRQFSLLPEGSRHGFVASLLLDSSVFGRRAAIRLQACSRSYPLPNKFLVLGRSTADAW